MLARCSETATSTGSHGLSPECLARELAQPLGLRNQKWLHGQDCQRHCDKMGREDWGVGSPETNVGIWAGTGGPPELRVNCELLGDPGTYLAPAVTGS